MYKVKLPNKFVAEALLKTAFDAGYKWGNCSSGDNPQSIEFLDKQNFYFRTNDKTVWYDGKETQTLSLNKIFELLKKEPVNYEVKFQVTVGGVTLDEGDMNKIREKMKTSLELSDTVFDFNYEEQTIRVKGTVITFNEAIKIFNIFNAYKEQCT